MTIVQWPSNIPSNFFSGNDQPKANTETTTFLSGRQVSWQSSTTLLARMQTLLLALPLEAGHIALCQFHSLKTRTRQSALLQWKLKRFIDEHYTDF